MVVASRTLERVCLKDIEYVKESPRSISLKWPGASVVQLLAPGPLNERFRKVPEGSKGARGPFNRPLLMTLYAFPLLSNPYEGLAPFSHPPEGFGAGLWRPVPFNQPLRGFWCGLLLLTNSPEGFGPSRPF